MQLEHGVLSRQLEREVSGQALAVVRAVGRDVFGLPVAALERMDFHLVEPKSVDDALRAVPVHENVEVPETHVDVLEAQANRGGIPCRLAVRIQERVEHRCRVRAHDELGRLVVANGLVEIAQFVLNRVHAQASPAHIGHVGGHEGVDSAEHVGGHTGNAALASALEDRLLKVNLLDLGLLSHVVEQDVAGVLPRRLIPGCLVGNGGGLEPLEVVVRLITASDRGDAEVIELRHGRPNDLDERSRGVGGGGGPANAAHTVERVVRHVGIEPDELPGGQVEQGARTGLVVSDRHDHVLAEKLAVVRGHVDGSLVKVDRLGGVGCLGGLVGLSPVENVLVDLVADPDRRKHGGFVRLQPHDPVDDIDLLIRERDRSVRNTSVVGVLGLSQEELGHWFALWGYLGATGREVPRS